jgi:hypothetical protein
MKFSILLFALAKIIKRAARKHAGVMEKVKEKNFTITIKTEDGSRGRYFTFSNGTLTSGKGEPQKTDVSLIWKNPEIGFKVMLKQSNKAFIKAIQDGAMKIQGDPNYLPAFLGIVKASMKPPK